MRRWMLMAGVVLAVSAATPATADADLFITPSGNIACGTGPSAGPYAIVCAVLSETTGRGQRIWAMRAQGRVRVYRSRSNAATDVKALRYGQRYRGLGVQCISRKSGLRCRNRSGHGFVLARERQRVF